MQRTMYDVWTLYNVRCTMFDVRCTMYGLFTMQWLKLPPQSCEVLIAIFFIRSLTPIAIGRLTSSSLFLKMIFQFNFRKGVNFRKGLNNDSSVLPFY